MNRRTFVAGAGMLAGASLLATGAPPLSPPALAADALADADSPLPARAATGRIDVHHHFLPPAHAEALQRRGLARFAGQAIAPWTAEGALALMDAQGMQAAILSLNAPGVHFGDDAAAATLARRCNEQAAELAARHPGRFGSFAVLPLPATELACKEAVHALDTLAADGVMLLASVDGQFLGDPRFDELMAELDRRHARVFVHPNQHISSTTLGLGTPGHLLEFACDTSRAAVNLILGGTLERYPRIDWILANGGGFLPYVAWRVSLANALPEFADSAPQGVLSYLRRFYFDTALAAASPSMAVLRELVEPAHILFGSDFPQAPAELVATQVQQLAGSELWSPALKAGIGRGHALSLFPRFAAAGEGVVAAPVNESESSLQWLGRNLKKPIGALAQHLKD
ncbi:amidohydrolase family protein [Pseudomonas tohonis]|uniref:amidohydrolase family protein n=1 Tax=Pseudomonas tohonis TaxID=2725477 RepID=UPI00255BB4D9|nr:amidohydrolase family protein [Pseudomonas tohonis]